MADTFPLAYGPVYPVARPKEPRNNVSTFGDGYEQRSGDGINTIRPEIPVKWTGLTKAEHDLVDAFLTEKSGLVGFMWTYPGETTPLKYVCKKWTPSLEGAGDNYMIDAVFVRDFNPG